MLKNGYVDIYLTRIMSNTLSIPNMADKKDLKQQPHLKNSQHSGYEFFIQGGLCELGSQSNKSYYTHSNTLLCTVYKQYTDLHDYITTQGKHPLPITNICHQQYWPAGSDFQYYYYYYYYNVILPFLWVSTGCFVVYKHFVRLTSLTNLHMAGVMCRLDADNDRVWCTTSSELCYKPCLMLSHSAITSPVKLLTGIRKLASHCHIIILNYA